MIPSLTAMNYDRDRVRELANSISLLDYAAQTIEFKKVGATEWSAHCPRHIDKTSSLFVSTDKNRFYCQSCHVGGDLISWMRIFEGKSYTEAVEKICEMTGGSAEKLKQCEAMGVYQRLRDMMMVNAPKHIDRKTYDESILRQYSSRPPEEWINEGIDWDIMKRFGVKIDDDNNRIIYPVYDDQDRLIGIKGRTRYKDYKLLGIQKYMNYMKIGTTDFFQGMKQNRQNIINKDEIIIVEGLKSVMKLTGWGYDNSVASETSSLSPGQLEIILRMHTRNVVVAFDQDVSYEKAVKTMKQLSRYTNVFIIHDTDGLLESKDSPCDKGLEVWEQLYNGRRKIYVR